MNKKEIVNVHKRPDEIFEIECFEKPLRTQITDLEQENKQLKEQLAKKDKRIAKLKDYIYSYNNEINNRPQVCNEYIDATCKDILEKMKELKL